MAPTTRSTTLGVGALDYALEHVLKHPIYHLVLNEEAIDSIDEFRKIEPSHWRTLWEEESLKYTI